MWTITILVAVLPMGSIDLLTEGLPACSISGDAGVSACSLVFAKDSLIAKVPDYADVKVEDFFSLNYLRVLTFSLLSCPAISLC